VVLLFDEMLNKTTQTKQLDILARFWNRDTISIRFISSFFLGHANAEVLLDKFRHEDVPVKKLLQISMGGPSVNWKFLKLFQDILQKDHNINLINIGSCGLHI